MGSREEAEEAEEAGGAEARRWPRVGTPLGSVRAWGGRPLPGFLPTARHCIRAIAVQGWRWIRCDRLCCMARGIRFPTPWPWREAAAWGVGSARTAIWPPPSKGVVVGWRGRCGTPPPTYLARMCCKPPNPPPHRHPRRTGRGLARCLEKGSWNGPDWRPEEATPVGHLCTPLLPLERAAPSFACPSSPFPKAASTRMRAAPPRSPPRAGVGMGISRPPPPPPPSRPPPPMHRPAAPHRRSRCTCSRMRKGSFSHRRKRPRAPPHQRRDPPPPVPPPSLAPPHPIRIVWPGPSPRRIRSARIFCVG